MTCYDGCGGCDGYSTATSPIQEEEDKYSMKGSYGSYDHNSMADSYDTHI